MTRACLASVIVLALPAGCTAIAPLGGYTFDLLDGGRDAGQTDEDAGPRDGGRDAGIDGGPDDAGTDGGPMCTEACGEPTPYCDLTMDACVQCLAPEHCDDGNVCTADRCELGGTCSSTLDTSCIAMIDAGGTHTCALKSTGRVECWGNNGDGQNGNGSTEPFASRARLVSGLVDAVEVTAGGSHTCARRVTGQVVCWGNNANGQLGSGTADSSVPIETVGVSDVVQLSAGGRHTCARTTTGAVVCWGSNFNGELGNGSTSTAPTAPTPVVDLSDAIDVSAGLFHTCAIRSTGQVVCWGGNFDGQLGDGTTDSAVRPVTVPVLDDAVAVVVGDSHTCARRATGAVLCWGFNSSGQLGDGATVSSSSPVSVIGVADAEGLTSTQLHSCVLRSAGSVVCWGKNETGQLGNGVSGTDAFSAIPVAVVDLPPANAITAGNAHTCARTGTATVYCWGASTFGQTGNGMTTTHPLPVLVLDL